MPVVREWTCTRVHESTDACMARRWTHARVHERMDACAMGVVDGRMTCKQACTQMCHCVCVCACECMGVREGQMEEGGERGGIYRITAGVGIEYCGHVLVKVHAMWQ